MILPIVMNLFVVALGTDYNILMISRLREELTPSITALVGHRAWWPGRQAVRRSAHPDGLTPADLAAVGGRPPAAP